MKQKFILSIILLCSGMSQLLAQNVIEEKTFPASAIKKVVMEVSGANISVTSTSQSDAMVIFNTTQNLGKVLDELDNNYTRSYELSSDGTLYIELKRKSKYSFSFGWGMNLAYVLQLPKSVKLELFTSGGNISVDGIIGSHVLKTSGGDIDLRKLTGALKVTTSGGNIETEEIAGDLFAKTSGGDIVIKRHFGNVDVTTSGGNIKLTDIEGSAKASTSGGDVRIDKITRFTDIKATTSGGNVKIILSENPDCQVELKTSGGEVNVSRALRSGFDGTIKKTSVVGQIGKGTGRIVAKTSGGDIDLTVLN